MMHCATAEQPQTVFDISCLTTTQVGSLIDQAYSVMKPRHLQLNLPPIKHHQASRPLPSLLPSKQIFKTDKFSRTEYRHHKKQSLLHVLNHAISSSSPSTQIFQNVKVYDLSTYAQVHAAANKQSMKQQGMQQMAHKMRVAEKIKILRLLK